MKILIIDTDETELLLTHQTLSEKFPAADIIGIDCRRTYEAAMARSDFDLAVTEYKLGWTNGLLLFADIRHRFPCIPVIMLTSSGNETIAVEAIKKGMADYIVKRERAALPDAIAQIIEKVRQEPQPAKFDIPYCERRDLAASGLTSHYAYSLRIPPNGKPEFEWLTEPFKKFLNEHGSAKDESEAAGYLGLMIHADDAAVVQNRYKDLLAGYENTTEYRIVTKQGDIRCFSDHALPIRDRAIGKVVRIYGAIEDITWRRNAEDKMRLMQRAIDCSNNGIVITGPAATDYAVIYANDAFLNLTGYALDELLGQNCRILQKDERDQLELNKLRAALTNEIDGYAILRNYRKDGSMFWNEMYISPIRDSRNRITHYLGVQNDVTRRCEMEALLTKNEAKMRAIFENVFDAIIIVDERGIVESANPSAEKIFGYTAAEISGLNIGRLLAGSQKHRDLLFPLNCLDGEKITGAGVRKEIYALKKDGTIFPISIGISELNLERRRLFIGTIHDLTESRHAEKALRTSEERYRTLFENSVEAIFVNRGENRIEQVNQACLKLWGAGKPEELLNKTPLELFHPDYHASTSKHATADRTVNPFTEEKIVRLDGTVADVLVSTVPFVDEKGPMLFVVVMDITERKKAEDALLESKKQYQELSNHLELIREEERTRIAREIHDELGSFLTVIKMDLSWLSKQIPADQEKCHEKVLVMTRLINEAIQTVKKIITDLRPSILDHLGLLPAIEWLAENFLQRTGINCILTIPETDRQLETDRSTAVFRIAQEALTNIIQHAEASQVTIDIEMNETNLLMTISDDGRGIASRHNYRNSGFGIHGMWERARHFDGDLTLVSEPETGTTIKLSIPLETTKSESNHD